MLKQNIPLRPLLSTVVAIALGISAHAEAVEAGLNEATLAKANFAALSQPNPYQQFIVKMSPTQGKQLQSAEIELQIREATRFTGYDVRYERPLALGQHLISVGGQLDRVGSETLMRAIANEPQVAYIEPNITMSVQFSPNDPRYNEQWHYTDSLAGINIEQAWDISNGSGVRVAVIDSGITDHPDINANVVGGYDFIVDSDSAADGNGRDSDPSDEGDWLPAGNGICGITAGQNSSWHGTHVAGTIAALTNNAEGVAGVAFGAEIVPVRAFGKCGGLLSDVAEAIIWSTGGFVPNVGTNPHPANIVNMSLGQGVACPSFLQDAINDSIITRDAFLVASAGNDSTDAAMQAPANCFGVFTVASLNRAGNLSDFSNFGDIVDVSAPGGQLNGSANEIGSVLSLGNTGTTLPQASTYSEKEGTSMAAPHVAGVAALLLGADPTLSSSDLTNIIKNTARPIPGSCPQNGCGAGLLDAEAALLSLGLPPLPDQDNDGIPDATDNCLIVANTDQRDTDDDGYGNICDPDLNNDLLVNVIDLGILRSVFFTNDPDADFNGDGVVNVVDLGIMRTFFFSPPGPSEVGTPAPPVLGLQVDDEPTPNQYIDFDGIYALFWDQEDPTDEYIVRRTTVNAPPEEDEIDILPLSSPSATSFQEVVTMSGLYQYEIQVCKQNGVCSEFSQPVNVNVFLFPGS
ncbi:MAG: S8 family serine peptidase [Gammaproteobacteria bacterium]